jgi:signal transduction histidine kinase
MSTPTPSKQALDSAAEDRLSQLLGENTRLGEKLEAEIGLRKKLEQELEQAIGAKQGAKDELQAFIYAASHDLKEPLRAISSYTQLLQRPGLSAAETEEYYRFIMDGVSAANALIEQLLRLSRAGASPRRTTVDLAAPVQTAIFKLQDLLKRAGGTVSVRELPSVSADEAQVTQVFENLIDNGIKYRGSEPPVIEISAEEGDEGHVISVKDNGPGIEPAYHNQIFLPFKRLHGRQIPGAGLGLSMCRKIVEAHEGRMWVESDGKNGSVFRFFLPY